MPRDVGLSVTVRQKTPRCFRVYPGLRYRHISENLTSLPSEAFALRTTETLFPYSTTMICPIDHGWFSQM